MGHMLGDTFVVAKAVAYWDKFKPCSGYFVKFTCASISLGWEGYSVVI